jgi:HK97 family phage major capsid protein
MNIHLPVHPVTGLQALGIGKRGPIWPVLGGSGSNSHASDSMIRKLETELEQRESFAQGLIESAENRGGDLSEDDKKRLVETRERMEEIKDQLEHLESVHRVAYETRHRAASVDEQITDQKRNTERGKIEYRSAGAYTLDMYNAAMGKRDAKERLQIFERQASDGGVDHMTMTDSEGIIPDPVVQPVINFIDAARPLVSALGVRGLPSASWHRPRVTQHTAVAKQTGEKEELVNQRMKIERIPVSADTYGGFVNVSRQIVDFSTPAGLDLVVNDLAAQYSIETEAAAAYELSSVATAAIDFDSGTVATLTSALWQAVAQVFTVTKGQGNLLIVCSPNAMGTFGPLFNPINPQNAQSTGFNASSFAQGVMGSISGLRTVMSTGLSGNDAFVLSTAAIEVYEQRIGTLQVTEPSVLGVQVAYAGYFATLVLEDGAIVPLNDTAGS